MLKFVVFVHLFNSSKQFDLVYRSIIQKRLRTSTADDTALAQKARRRRHERRGLLERVERLGNGGRTPDVALELRLAKDFLAPVERRECKEDRDDDEIRTRQLLRDVRCGRRVIVRRDHADEGQDKDGDDENPRDDVIIQVGHLFVYIGNRT